MSNAIQDLYKKGTLTPVEELISKVTNYAWSEMTLLQQQELRKNALAHYASLLVVAEGMADALKRVEPQIKGILPVQDVKSALEAYEAWKKGNE